MRRELKDLCCKAPGEHKTASPDEEQIMKLSIAHRGCGNGPGAYLNSGTIIARPKVQNAEGFPQNDGVIFIHGSGCSAAGYAIRDVSIYTEGDTCRADIQKKAYKNQNPVIATGKSACSHACEYQAGGTIFVLGLYFNKAPVFRFFKTVMQARETLPKPIWLRSGSMRMHFSHASGWTGFLKNYFTSRPLKQKSMQTVVSNITARGVIFCEG